jgi:hypothetical protein
MIQRIRLQELGFAEMARVTITIYALFPIFNNSPCTLNAIPLLYMYIFFLGDQIAQTLPFGQPGYLAPKGISLLCITFYPVPRVRTIFSVHIIFILKFSVLCASGKHKAGTHPKQPVALQGHSGEFYF